MDCSYEDLMFLSYNFNIYISSGPVLIDLFLFMGLIFLLFSMISNFFIASDNVHFIIILSQTLLFSFMWNKS